MPTQDFNTAIVPHSGIIETEYMQYWMWGEILVGKYKDGLLVGLDAAKKMVSHRNQAFPGPKKYMILADGLGAISPEARAFLASKEAVEDIIKGAFIVRNPIICAFVNAFLIVNRPVKPARLFTNIDAASRWLLK